MEIENADVWNPLIYTANVSSKESFCLTLAELEYDDPFTAIIEFDARFAQPWARTNVSREICAVTSLDQTKGWPARYGALSNEGDFYLLDQKPTTEKIGGAGVLSADAAGDGALFDLAQFGNRLWSVGGSGQIFTKTYEGPWQRIVFPLRQPAGFKQVDFGCINGSDADDIYICGVLKPEAVKLDIPTTERLTRENASQQEWDEAYDEAERNMPSLRKNNEGRLYHWDGQSFSEVEIPVINGTIFRDLFVETRDRIWVAGTNGVLLEGNAANGFRLAADFGQSQRLISMTKLGNRYIIASQNQLYQFDGSRSVLLKPLPRVNPLRPCTIQAVEDVLFLFDYHSGVFRYDGKVWEEIKIPKELFARDFKGL